MVLVVLELGRNVVDPLRAGITLRGLSLRHDNRITRGFKEICRWCRASALGLRGCASGQTQR